jgi:hypothetical protein
VVSLGHHLRPDQHCPVCGRERAKSRGELARFPDRICVEPEPLELGDSLLELSLESLRPRSDPGEVDRAAGGTGLGGRLREAAVVAVQRVVAVQDKRDIAVRAPSRLATRPAMDRGRDPSAVEQQDRLAALLGQLPELCEEGRRERVAGLTAKVDHAHGRQRGADPLTQLEPLERRPALGARRGASIDPDGAFERSPLRCDRPRVVPGIGLLLVRGVVLLVDADQPQPRKRRKDGRPCADHDRSRA